MYTCISIAIYTTVSAVYKNYISLIDRRPGGLTESINEQTEDDYEDGMYTKVIDRDWPRKKYGKLE